MTDRRTLIFEKSGCKYLKQKGYWNCKCELDNSRRHFNCWEKCPNCKPLLKDRLKTAWHILTWNRRYIRNAR